MKVLLIKQLDKSQLFRAPWLVRCSVNNPIKPVKLLMSYGVLKSVHRQNLSLSKHGNQANSKVKKQKQHKTKKGIHCWL